MLIISRLFFLFISLQQSILFFIRRDDYFQYFPKLILLQNNVIALVREGLVYRTINDTSISTIDWPYYADNFTSSPITKGTYSLIASICNRDNDSISIVEIKEDLTFVEKVSISISRTQHITGFSQFNQDNLYILSYIDDINEGQIQLYNYDDNSLLFVATIIDFFEDVDYKVFQCHYINEITITICLAFSQSDTYRITLYDLSFNIVYSIDIPLFIDCTFCNVDTVNIYLIVINSNQFIIVKSFDYSSFDLLSYNSDMSITRQKTINIDTYKKNTFRNAHYKVLNDNYLLFIDDKLGGAFLFFLLYIPNMRFISGEN